MKQLPSQDGEEEGTEGGGRALLLARLFPNMVTLLGLCAGLTAVRYAVDGRWSLSVTLIIVAACIDALDGRLARLLHSTSRFGAQLDSLADFINFGVAPAFILYQWQMHHIRGSGWAVALFYAICCAIRLARFNSELDTEGASPPWAHQFFTGMPSPAGALIVLGPLVTVFAFKEEYPNLFQILDFAVIPGFVCGYAAVLALLMASRIPTFSFKNIRIRRDYVTLILAAAGLYAIAFVTAPWVTLFATGFAYCCSLPLSALRYYRMVHGASSEEKADPR